MPRMGSLGPRRYYRWSGTLVRGIGGHNLDTLPKADRATRQSSATSRKSQLRTNLTYCRSEPPGA